MRLIQSLGKFDDEFTFWPIEKIRNNNGFVEVIVKEHLFQGYELSIQKLFRL